MRSSPQPTVKPERRYGGAKYPTLVANRRTRRRRKAKTILWALLGIFLGLTRKTEATDIAKWTFDEPSTPPDVRHPIHGIHYATACRSGPVWDPVRLHRSINLRDLSRSPGVYRNDFIKTSGILRRAQPAPFGEGRSYYIVDPSIRFELWLVWDRFEYSLDPEAKPMEALVGREVEVVGELKIELKRFVDGFENGAFRTVWSIGPSDVRPFWIRDISKE